MLKLWAMKPSHAPVHHYASDRGFALLSWGLSAGVLLLLGLSGALHISATPRIQSPTVVDTITILNRMAAGLAGAALALGFLQRKERNGEWALASSLFVAVIMIAAFTWGGLLSKKKQAAPLGAKGTASTATFAPR